MIDFRVWKLDWGALPLNPFGVEYYRPKYDYQVLSVLCVWVARLVVVFFAAGVLEESRRSQPATSFLPAMALSWLRRPLSFQEFRSSDGRIQPRRT